MERTIRKIKNSKGKKSISLKAAVSHARRDSYVTVRFHLKGSGCERSAQIRVYGEQKRQSVQGEIVDFGGPL